MLISVLAEKLETGEQKTFYLDNITGLIREEPFEPVVIAEKVDLAERSKPSLVRRIKIQLGLSCNYSCSYCSQRFVERPPETTSRDINDFMVLFAHIPKTEQFKVEFWGGEPLVYWKTLKPLAERIRQHYPNAAFSIISNGSLLTKEIIDWLDVMGFGVAISHDGPGQAVRGEDPLVTKREVFVYALQVLYTKGRFAFNACLNKRNQSRVAIIEFFENTFPGYRFRHGEMNLVDAYDEGGMEALSFSRKEHFAFRRNSWAELRFQAERLHHCSDQSDRVKQLVMKNGSEAQVSEISAWAIAGAPMKCGMDTPESLAIDMKGNVITCQNTSAVAVAGNGESHKVGHVHALADVRLKTATHWTQRPNCSGCPVLSLCKGSCMYLYGDNWWTSCDGEFSNNVALLALAFEKVTGFVPVRFDAEHLPAHRQDIWGAAPCWEEESENLTKRSFPVKVVSTAA